MRKAKLIFLIGGFALLFGYSANAANPSIYFHLPATSVAPGSEFELTVFVKSDADLNAFQGAVEFTPENLEFIGYADSNSIIDIWQTKPSLTGDRLIIFAGGRYVPFKGDAGELVKLKFRAKSVGTSGFALRDPSVYLADGQGTQLVPNAFYIRLSIDEKASKLVLGDSSDRTPPRINISKINDPVGGDELLVFEIEDKESGGGQAIFRNFENWSWSEWQEIKGPMKFPESAWILQVKAKNGSGEENSKFIFNKSLKQVLAVLILIIALYLIYLWYNKYKLNKKLFRWS